MPGDRRVFTVPAGVPFLDTLVAALVDGRLIGGFTPSADPLAMADVTIYLPTRRAARAIREPLLRAGSGATVLPRILTLGDIDEDDLETPFAGTGDDDALPPAIGEVERQLTLTRLVLGWSGAMVRAAAGLGDEVQAVPASPADAARLARALGDFLDRFGAQGGEWSALDRIAADDLAGHWSITLEFLKIIRERWPTYLTAAGALDPGVRRDQLIRAEADRLAGGGAAGPVIAAGSTGSVPATAALLAAIAGRPNGAVVLPGLDEAMDEETWDAVDALDQRGRRRDAAAGHPQFGLKTLLAALGVGRDAVVPLAEAVEPLAGRAWLVSEALRPAETTDRWATGAMADDAIDAAIARLGLIGAANEREEALAIALVLREAAEDTDSVSALITPDRNLARRVAAELRRWGIAVDDSAGTPLAETGAGSFAALVAEVAFGGFRPHPLLALLKHPLARMAAARGLRAMAAFERIVLRGPAPPVGLDGLKGRFAALASAWRNREPGGRRPRAIARLFEEDWAATESVLRHLEAAFEPVAALDPGRPHKRPFAALAAAHREAIARLAGAGDGAAADDPAVETLNALFDDIAAAGAAAGPEIDLADYPGLFAALGETRRVRRASGDPRLHIWGTLEARLQRADTVVLGGLNEAVWPGETRLDPFLSRGMRATLALDPPERRIGLAAHDFAQGLGHATVWLARADRTDGTPQVASRWLQRMLAFIGPERAMALEQRGRRFLDIGTAIDRPRGPREPVRRPCPKPALAFRPKSLSVTRIETMIRDPYAIYAQYVLRLRPLEAVAEPVGARERGMLVHDVLNRLVRELPEGPFDRAAHERLLAIGKEAFAGFADEPAVVMLWWPRFARIAEWFVEVEAARAGVRRSTEIDGELVLPGDFHLTARADRIDRMADGRLAIIDYKTGTPPSPAMVISLLAPQLPLEALIAGAGGFDGVAAAEVAALAYYRISGRSPEPGRIEPRGADSRGAARVTLAETIGKSERALRDLVAFYADPANGYASRRIPRREREFPGDYDHLARVAEWALEVPE